MQFKHALTLLGSVWLLSACGGGSGEDAGGGGGVTAPLNANYYGMWQLDGDTYVGISERSISTYVRDPGRGCFVVDLFKTVSSTVNSMVSEDVTTGERSASLFSLNGSNLRVTEGNVTLEFFSSDLPDISNGCDSSDNARRLNFDIELEYLPPVVLINRNAQLTGRVEYSYGVHFDINQNNIVDAGDVAIQVQHFKSNSGVQEEKPLADLGSNIWSFVPRQQAQGYGSTSNSNSAAMVQLNQEDKKLVFSVDMTKHALLRFISADTPLFLYSYINYPQPETAVIPGWSDGPWNWSSETHEDRYPDTGFTRLSLHPNMQMLDAANDLSNGQAKWVDIKTINFNFIN